MRTIWKFELSKPDGQFIEMPVGAEVLCVQMQGSTPCLWAKVDDSAPKEQRYFVVFGTGHRIPDRWGLKYIDTFQMHGGALVFHAFEKLEATD